MDEVLIFGILYAAFAYILAMATIGLGIYVLVKLYEERQSEFVIFPQKMFATLKNAGYWIEYKNIIFSKGFILHWQGYKFHVVPGKFEKYTLIFMPDLKKIIPYAALITFISIFFFILIPFLIIFLLPLEFVVITYFLRKREITKNEMLLLAAQNEILPLINNIDL